MAAFSFSFNVAAPQMFLAIALLPFVKAWTALSTNNIQRLNHHVVK
jgi:undecaprenyl pyrophosphate phosphatase UppP